MTKIIYLGLKYNYYDPQKGESFEHCNFYPSLKALPDTEVIYLPFERILEVGKKKFNEELLATAQREKPAALFAFMVSDEFEESVLQELKKITPTLAWFADDSWRFYNYSRYWGKFFTWAITTYSWVPALYHRSGQPNVIRSQWAVNPKIYKPPVGKESGPRPDVTFVGGWSKPRQKLISSLQNAGIKVEVYGGGWSHGRLNEEAMIRLFGVSKINLGLNPPPGYFNQNSLGRLLFRRSLDKIVPDLHFFDNFETWLNRGIPQIKARQFEIPACGGFLMTSSADDLGSFYALNQEIVVYDNLADLIEKIKYYLNHDVEREAIARAGYQRTIRDHTYEKRFKEIFKLVGLKI